MLNGDVISMPDKWEYPWYAAWDLAFHTISLSLVDFDFAKEQLLLMLRSLYSHPNGQIPAYEWNFSDVNPPGARLGDAVPLQDREEPGPRGPPVPGALVPGPDAQLQLVGEPQGPAGQERLRRRVPRARQHRRLRPQRPAPHRRLPGAGRRHRLDGLLLPEHAGDGAHPRRRTTRSTRRSPSSSSRTSSGSPTRWTRPASTTDDMWDEEDGFFYDVLRLPDGDAFRLKVRSMVGLLPLCASTMFEADLATRHPKLVELIALFKKRHPEVVAHVAPTIDGFIGHAGRRLLSPLTRDEARARPLLPARREGVPRPVRHPLPLAPPPRATRSSSTRAARSYRVHYLPAESNNGMFGGNSNWRGPVWMPVNVLLIRGLLNLYGFYGDDFTVECPTGSGNRMTLFEVAKEISRRLSGHLPARRERPPAGLRRLGEVPGRPALARPDPLLRVLPRRQRRRPRRQPPDGLDGPRRTPARPLRPRDGRGRAEGPPRRGSRPAWSGSRWTASRRSLVQRRAIPRSSRSTRGSGSRSLRPRSGARPRSTTSPTRSSTGWPRTGSTSSGSSASGRPARRRGASRGRIPSGSPSTAASSPTSARTTSAAPASPSGTTASTRTSAATRRSPGCAQRLRVAACA